MLPFMEQKNYKIMLERLFMLIDFLKGKVENYEIREFLQPVPFVREDYSLDCVLDRNISQNQWICRLNKALILFQEINIKR